MEAGDPFDLIEVPTVAEYKQAFKACRDNGAFRGEKRIRLEMLQLNYEAPNHTVTAGELAAHANIAKLTTSNNQYGNLAKELSKHLGKLPESRASRAGKKPIWLAMLVKFSGGTAGGRPTDDDESIQWTLLPQVVTALSETFFAHLPPQS